MIGKTGRARPTLCATEREETAITDTIYLNFSSMEEAEASFERVLKDLRHQLAELDHRVASGLKDWEGPAKEAYTAFQAQWRSEAQTMADKLQWLHGVIRTTRSNHHSARTTNLSNWRGHDR